MTWYNILHEPETWLAIAIWAVGAFCGVAVSWAAIEISERRETRESASSDVDRASFDGSGDGTGGAAVGKREGSG